MELVPRSPFLPNLLGPRKFGAPEAELPKEQIRSQGPGPSGDVFAGVNSLMVPFCELSFMWELPWSC